MLESTFVLCFAFVVFTTLLFASWATLHVAIYIHDRKDRKNNVG